MRKQRDRLRHRRRGGQHLTRHNHLRFETLETRRVLATFLVTNLDDSGTGSLRQAVLNANANGGLDTIQVQAFGTIELTSQIQIDDALTIVGPGDVFGGTTVDAQDNSRIFLVDRGAGNVTIQGLSLTGGNSGATVGGAIRFDSAGLLTIRDSVITDNTSDDDGGAIHTINGNVLVLNSTLSNNVAGDEGGAIRNIGAVVSISNSDLIGNSAGNRGGAISNDGGFQLAPGVFFLGIGTTVVYESTLSANSSVDVGGAIANGNIELQRSTIAGNSAGENGGGLFTFSGSVTVDNSTVSGNVAAVSGGGIDAERGAMSINNTTITGNTAGVSGGGIRVDTAEGATLDIASAIIAHNTAISNSDFGGISSSISLSVTNSLIGDNSGTTLAEAQPPLPDSSGNFVGDAAGGGIVDPGLTALGNFGGVTQAHALLPGSVAIDAGSNPQLLPTDQRGGGFPRQFGTSVDMGAFELRDVLVVNTSDDEFDSVFDSTDNSLREAIAVATGGGVDAILFDNSLANQTVEMDPALGPFEIPLSLMILGLGPGSSTIDALGNSRIFDVTSENGGLFLDGFQLTGGDAGNDDGGAIRSNTSSVLINNSHLTGNAANNGGGIFTASGDLTVIGSTVSANSALMAGGGIGAIDGNVTVSQSTISLNQSQFGGAGILANNTAHVTITDSSITDNAVLGSSSGGGISVQNLAASLSITESSVSGNTAGSGGGIFNAGTTTVSTSTISGNSATDENGDGGGGLQGGDMTLIDSTLSGNVTTSQGGGLSTFYGYVVVTDSTITGNSAARSGGGMSIGEDDLVLTRSTISGNVTDGSGGGIDAYLRITVVDSTISGNSAAFRGGGVSTNGANLTNSSVFGNTAGLDGGGIHSGYAVTISDSIISGNSAAAARGGGIYVRYDVDIVDSTISGNSSQGSGGGVMTNSGAVNVSGSTISNNAGARGLFAGGGGGGIYSTSGDITVTSSTLSGNSANTLGGGIYGKTGNIVIENSTVANNAVYAGRGGGIRVDPITGGTLTITSSIVAANSAADDSDISGVSAPLTNKSLIGDNTGTTLTENQPPIPDANGNFIGTSADPINPLLGPLGFNGGTTQTHGLLPGSPAINFGSSDSQTTDQRGFPREFPPGSGIDMGAFELGRFFVVDTENDTSDANPGNGLCDDGTGSCSIRAAISETNALANSGGTPDTVFFDITGSGVHTITPATALPTISDGVILDATSESDYAGSPLIQIDGNGGAFDGLKVTSGDSTIRGFSIIGLPNHDGIELNGSSGNAVELNHLGLDAAGNAVGNFFGLRVQNSANNQIDQNVISGNRRAGVFLTGFLSSGNVLTSNLIGTDPSGTSARPNITDGLTIQAPDNRIGLPGQGNTISGNDRWGVFTKLGGTGTIVQGNQIGTDITGVVPLPNVIGIYMQNGTNLIGGARGLGNVISGNNAYGLAIAFTTGIDNVIQGNAIGTDASGTVDVGNGLFGVRITQGSDNTIGGNNELQANLISGNGTGVLIVYPQASGNHLIGNRIGTDITGDVALGNAASGVRIVQGANHNVIEGNQISGNGGRAVSTDAVNGANNDILFNLIGTNAAGTDPLLNLQTGGAVRLRSPGSRVEGNVITSTDIGILAFRDATDLEIINNWIGTDESQTSSTLGMDIAIKVIFGSQNNLIRGNVMANNNKGVSIVNGSGNTITQNSIFDNALIGIDLGDDGATANDAGDVDVGTNNLQNSPELSQATLAENQLTITYKVDSLVTSSQYPLTIEFFLSDGNGQGQTLLGIDQYAATNAQANKQITLTVNGVTAGNTIVATATDLLGNTGEFGLEFSVTN